MHRSSDHHNLQVEPTSAVLTSMHYVLHYAMHYVMHYVMQVELTSAVLVLEHDTGSLALTRGGLV